MSLCKKCGKETGFKHRLICLDCKYNPFINPVEKIIIEKVYIRTGIDALKLKLKSVRNENKVFKNDLKKCYALINKLKNENEDLKKEIVKAKDDFPVEKLKKEYELKIYELQKKLNEISNIEKLNDLKIAVSEYPEQLKDVKYGIAELEFSSDMPKVYFLVSNDKVVYVGKTEKRLPLRITEHIKEKGNCFNKVFYTDVEPGFLNFVERKYIKLFQPELNVIYNRGKK